MSALPLCPPHRHGRPQGSAQPVTHLTPRSAASPAGRPVAPAAAQPEDDSFPLDDDSFYEVDSAELLELEPSQVHQHVSHLPAGAQLTSDG